MEPLGVVSGATGSALAGECARTAMAAHEQGAARAQAQAEPMRAESAAEPEPAPPPPEATPAIAPPVPPPVPPPQPGLGKVFAGATASSPHDPAPGRVTCASCHAEYVLPPDLVPAWGGRVRCPRCSEIFSVGPRAEADALLASMIASDEAAWRRALDGGRLWADFGRALLEAYGELRQRLGPEIAARAFRRALEAAAPGVPWFAPPTPKNPLGDGAIQTETLFERRRNR